MNIMDITFEKQAVCSLSSDATREERQSRASIGDNSACPFVFCYAGIVIKSPLAKSSFINITKTTQRRGTTATHDLPPSYISDLISILQSFRLWNDRPFDIKSLLTLDHVSKHAFF